MNTTRAKQSDIFGHSSEDDKSPIGAKMKSNSPAPMSQWGANTRNDPPDAAQQMQYGGDSAAKVPSMVFPRTRPFQQQQQQQQQQHDRMNEHYTGPVDVDSDDEFFRSLMNGIKVSGRTKRPSVDSAGASSPALKTTQYYQGTRTGGMYQGRQNEDTSSTVTFQTFANTSRPNYVSRDAYYEHHDASPEPRSRLKSILMNKKQDNQSETATNVTRGSSASSFFGNARSKLKGYLSTYKHRKQSSDNEHHERDPQSIPGAQEEAGGSYISGTKTPKYRQTVNQNRHSNLSSKSPDYSTSFHLQHKFSGGSQSIASSTDADAISHTNTIKTKYHENASVSSKNSKNSKKRAKKKAMKSSGQDYPDEKFQVQVFDLPWADNRPDSQLRGRYSGPVDHALLPHGKGKVVLQGRESLKCYGIFKHGRLASNLICQNEGVREETEIEDADDIGSSANNMTSTPTTDNTTRKRAPQEPSGVLSDDVPRNSPQEHHHHVHKKKATKKPPVKAPATERRATVESCTSEDVRQNFTSRRTSESGSKIHDTPVSDPMSDDPNTVPSSSRLKYMLGDIARSPRDMIIFKSNNEAIQSASLLKKYEQAFLKRSNGLWTSAILADRSLQPTKGKQFSSSHWYTEWEIDPTTMELEDSMLFVINGDGATKIVQRRHWGKFVRRMNVHNMEKVVEEEADKSSAAGTDEA
jgi:hypothetical protein